MNNNNNNSEHLAKAMVRKFKVACKNRDRGAFNSSMLTTISHLVGLPKDDPNLQVLGERFLRTYDQYRRMLEAQS